jgi:histidine triad (HIT) family protein
MIDGCPFCGYAGPSPVLADLGPAYVIEPLDPVIPGHLLVVAKAHLPDALASPASFGYLAEQAARYAVGQGLRACNLIVNVGRAATQSVDHLHLHIVPRVADDGLRLPWTPLS